MKFNLKDGAGVSLPGSDMVTVLCDGPNGAATSLAIWLSKEIAESGQPPAIRFDFDEPSDLLAFCSLNFEMARTVMLGLFQLEGETRPAGKGGH